MKLVEGSKFVYLYRSAYNINDEEESIVDMEVINKNGKLQAISKSKVVGWIKFDLDQKTIQQLTGKTHPLTTIFATREEALNQLKKESQVSVKGIMNLSKEELVERLFRAWDDGDVIGDVAYSKAMKDKIKEELGVEL